MSNPGVIYLAQGKTKKYVSFRIEDNIGEAIHIHYGELRISMTINDFLNAVGSMILAVDKLIQVPGFSSNDFDPVFLHDISHLLMDLESVEKTTIRMDDILVQTVGILGLPVIRSIKDSRVVKALHGNDVELNKYKQENLRGQSNIDRMNDIYESIKNKGYPYKEQYIVFFNIQNMIRDGQHRAACLYGYSGGGVDIPIIRLHFKNGAHGVSKYPWVAYLFRWNKRRVKNLVRKIIKKSYKLLREILLKLKRIILSRKKMI